MNEVVILIILTAGLNLVVFGLGAFSPGDWLGNVDYLYAVFLVNLFLTAAIVSTLAIRRRRLREMRKPDHESEHRDVFVQEFRELRRQHEQELQRLQSSSEEDVDVFASIIHEIKTPIAVAKLLCEDWPQEVRRQLTPQLRRMEEELQKALFQIRSSSAGRDFKLQEILLSELVRERLVDFDTVFKARGITVELLDGDQAHPSVGGGAAAVSVRSDRKWLSFVIDQILQNAGRYVHSGGALRISITGRADAVELRIVDNGPGIPPEDLPRIFDRGFTGGAGRANQTSSGLGLFLARNLCRRMGHELVAESPAKDMDSLSGAAFIITFPEWSGLFETERTGQ